MPNDAKLGLVVGVGLVIAVAVMYFRKDVATADPAEAAASASVKPKPGHKAPGAAKKPVKGRPTAHVNSADDADGAADPEEGDPGDVYEVDHQQLPTPKVLLQAIGATVKELLPQTSEPAEQPAEQKGDDADKGQ